MTSRKTKQAKPKLQMKTREVRLHTDESVRFAERVARQALLAAFGALMAMTISIIAAGVSLVLVTRNFPSTSLGSSDQQVEEQSLRIPKLTLGSAYCDAFLREEYAEPRTGVSVYLPHFERCREASTEKFQEVLAHTARRAGYLRFDSDKPYHLWWQARVVVSDEFGNSGHYLTPWYDIRGATIDRPTEIQWGNCSDFPEYPDASDVSLTTVVVYPCSYLGGVPPFRVVIYELVEGQWVTNWFTYESEEDFIQYYEGGRVVCPVHMDTVNAYGYDEETIEFLCRPFLR